MPKVQVIEAHKPLLPERKKVAAYARVSVDTDQLMHSLSAQISYYSDLIQRTPEWEYVGVYADAGITGTDATVRPKFQQMIADCEAGKIDIVLTKSISRFARNTVDLLSTVRHLKGLGVGVRFEKERINTFTADGEVMLTILASFAEQESISLSQNLKWTVRKRYEQGRVMGHMKLFGYEWKDGERVIVPEEAEIVRFVFAEYLSGKTYTEIARELDEMGVSSVKGKENFPRMSVRCMLSNEEYTGCQILQQSYAPKPKKLVKNKGEMPKFKIEEHHEAIIDPETFAAVQQMRAERGRRHLHGNRVLSPCSGMVVCGTCGARVDMHSTNNHRFRYWICSRKNDTCFCKNTPDKFMQAALESIFGEEFEKDARKQIRQVIMYNDSLEFQLRNGGKSTWQKP